MHPVLTERYVAERRRDLERLAAARRPGRARAARPGALEAAGAEPVRRARAVCGPSRPIPARGARGYLGGLLIRAGTRLAGSEPVGLSTGR